MTFPNIIRFADLQPTIVQQHPDPNNRIKGNPLRTSAKYIVSEESGLSSGFWNAEVGAYRISYPEGKNEFFQILSGCVQIQAIDHAPVNFGPGDVGMIPSGFEGVFEVVEPASKFWVVSDRSGK